MNWLKLKNDFPNTHGEIREYFEKNEGTATNSMLMSRFFTEKGYNAYPSWIGSLRDYEAKKAKGAELKS